MFHVEHRPARLPMARRYSPRGAGQHGLTLVELLVAITICGLVAGAAVTAARIGMSAWEKEQRAVSRMRRVANIEDGLQQQLSSVLVRPVSVDLANRRETMPFFFGEPRRLVMLSGYALAEGGRGGIVVADYLAERQEDGACTLWLDERRALDQQDLAARVAGLAPGERQMEAVLRPFDHGRALVLFEGLTECGFRYLPESPPGSRLTNQDGVEWRNRWSTVEQRGLPAAINVHLATDPDRWEGLAPAPVFADLRLSGLTRAVTQ